MQRAFLSVIAMYQMEPDMFAPIDSVHIGPTGGWKWDPEKRQRVPDQSVPFGYNYNTDGALTLQLLAECGNLEVLYPDPEFLKNQISMWAWSRRECWDRMNAAFYSLYNPIHNYDRNETYTDSSAGSSNSSGSTTAEHNTTTNVSAFDDLDPATRDSVTGSSGGSTTASGSSTTKHEHSGHLFGNIGTTKTQEMISDELDLRATDIFQMIISEFKEKFCIMIY